MKTEEKTEEKAPEAPEPVRLNMRLPVETAEDIERLREKLRDYVF